jgi:nitrate/TMAO reductase-like tetraheme cytochrome c subunit
MNIFRDFGSAAWEVIKLPFWLIGQGWKRFFALGGRRISLLVVAALIVTVVALGTLVEITSQPNFCVSCHFMKPYFDSWRISDHKQIACIKCHIPPGVGGTIRAKFMALSMVVDYTTGVYKRSKPWAEIEDASCLREGCHQTRLLQGEVNFKGVVFNHTPHLTEMRRGLHLRCTSCHGQIVQGQHITVTESTCFLCHFMPDTTGKETSLARCTHCHQPPTGQAAADTSFDHSSVLTRGVDCLSCHSTAVVGDGYVPPERCNSCHASLAHIERYNDVDFVHTMHVMTHKVDCQNCHLAIRHGTEATTVKNPQPKCIECHGGPNSPIAAVWHGTLPNLPPSPSVMAKLGMSCDACHVEPIHHDGTAATTEKFSRPQCSPCHTENYNSLWPMWKAPLAQQIESLSREAQKLPEPQRSKALAGLNMYKAGDPVHNPDLIAAIAGEINGQPSQPSVEKCTSCHPAALNIAPSWNGLLVPHGLHAQNGITCETCHKTTEPDHGKLKLTLDQCNNCHHTRAAKQGCLPCHDVQSSVFNGKISNPAGETPSPMAGSVNCTDCHALKGNQVTRRNPDACASCHEPAYADTLKRWEVQGDSLLNLAETRMKSLSAGNAKYQDYQQLAAAIRRDRSRTVHNSVLFTDWMKRIEVAP